MELGDFRIDVVSGGPFRLDGGSMFGIVPKPLWERLFHADERNCIPLDTNCAVIRGRGAVVLVDTGNGTKLEAKEREIFALDSEVTLVNSLAALGVQPEDVTHVFFTHLHMDHAGGGTTLNGDGHPVPTFPMARYLAQRTEWEDALANRSHMRVSYRKENLLPLLERDQLELLDGEPEFLPGLRPVVTGGHTRGHQALRIESGGRTALCFGDLCPTTAHLRGPYLMAYDLDPLTSMQRKTALIEQAARDGWLVLFDHDPHVRIATVSDTGAGRYEAERLE